jgi:hypothetical protein
MELWFRPSGWLALSMSIALPASADPPETTVFFGVPAAEAQIIEMAVAVEAGEPVAEAPRGAPHDAAAAPPSCAGRVTIERRFSGRREAIEMPLLDCDGRPREEAVRALSILARPRTVEAPPGSSEIARWRETNGDPDLLADGVRVVDAELLVRLQRIGDAFPGHTIEIVSGYRPSAPDHSRHHHARALDVAVDGVPREALRDLARSFERTGVGWYPNSTFVHIDVRDESTYWVDVSAPGEAPRYVRDAEETAEAETNEEVPPSADERAVIRREIQDLLRAFDEVPAT